MSDGELAVKTTSPLLAAGTVILLREMPGSPLEFLMIQRGTTLAFAGGAWAFPGGRIDADDHVVSRALRPDLTGDAADDAAARIGATRETIEEVGIVPGFALRPADPIIDTVRRRLKNGEPLSVMLAETTSWIDLESLTPFARWVPPGNPVRRFDTRFFVARVPHDAMPSVDGEECIGARWVTAAGMLDEYARGLVDAMFPTRCNLERLAQLHSHAHVIEHLEAYPVRTLHIEIADRDGVPHRQMPEGYGYPPLWEPIPPD